MFESLDHQIATNSELGQAYFYWESKKGRMFLASQVTKELGYKRNSTQVLLGLNLVDGIDKIKFLKKDNPELFVQLTNMNVSGSRASEIIMLSESGFWKLVMQSYKSVGIRTRTWLAGEVLPSIRKTGMYVVPPNTGMDTFTERSKQLELSKSTNSIISKSIRTGEEYSKFWNDLHLLVVGLNAKQIKDLYKSKESAKQVLRQHAPHLEATEAVIEDFWARGIGLEKVKDTGFNVSLAQTFKIMLDWGIDLKTLGK